MKRLEFICRRGIQFIALFTLIIVFNQCKEPASLSALIVTDAGEHVSEDLQSILENTGLFDADINKAKAPNFSNYDVVVLNLSKGEWSDDVRSEFVSYINGGGGAVVLGASALAFGDWTELNKVTGLTTGAKIAKSKDAFEFQLVGSKEKHPITDGLQSKWMHTEDYLIFNSETLTGDAEILATAWADTLQGGNGAYLPVLFTVGSGEGRIFHSTLGTSTSDDYLDPIQCVGFITTLQRGAEWAATGVVSQVAPIDFPNSASTHTWVDYKPLDLDDILEKCQSYEIGKSKKYLTDFSMRVRHSDGKAASYALLEDKILDYLDSDASIDSKKYMCRELSWIGSEKSIAVLEKLINDKDLSESASFALKRLRM